MIALIIIIAYMLIGVLFGSAIYVFGYPDGCEDGEQATFWGMIWPLFMVLLALFSLAYYVAIPLLKKVKNRFQKHSNK